MADNDNDKPKRGDVLSPRQSFNEGAKRRRREPELQAPIKPASTSPEASAPRAPGEVLLTWRVDRLRERPLVTLVVIATLIGLFAWLRSITGSWLTSTVLTGLVIVSLSQFLFPTTFTLHENGLAIANLRREYKAWSLFGIMRVYPDAVQIGPRVTGVRARWNRGTVVYFGKADKEQVTRIIRERLGLTEAAE